MKSEPKKLKKIEDVLAGAAETMIGYPINLAADYSPCSSFSGYHLNNVGDPYTDSLYRINTKKQERDVLAWFCRLFRLPARKGWGYVTSGGTEGNIYGLWLARERFPDATLFFSKDGHYSLYKAARLLRMKYQIVPTNTDGTMRISSLARFLKTNRPASVILSLTVGTTMKGAVDDIRGAVTCLKKYGISSFHIHIDAALMGMMMPFWEKKRRVDFSLPIDSISCSGHKFLGVPIPCGVVLTKKSYVSAIQQSIEYIGSRDATITGSRNGHAVLYLWYAIRTWGTNEIGRWAKSCGTNARYLYRKLRASKYRAAFNRGSITVVIQRPDDAIVHKWQLAVQGEWAHIVVMPHVTKVVIDRFLRELLHT